MAINRVVIAGVSSGVGKTMITIGLMSAFKQMGLSVQGFKCGPDYIDPTYHTAVTKRPSRNLDSWMLSSEIVREVFVNGSKDSDISVIEGVMGFYDGKSATSNEGSTAEISRLLDCPTVLVVDCSKMARSAAAIVRGYQLLDPHVRIVGVIANRVGSKGHYQLIKQAIEQECCIPVLGYLLENKKLNLPERHLGLVPSIERGELDGFFKELGQVMKETIHIEKILELSKQQKEIQVNSTLLLKQRPSLDLTIAVAKDEAFNFYYQENLELIEAFGAKIAYFSPLRGETIPDDADGLYIGGGFPEMFAEQLANQEEVKKSIKAKLDAGLPTLAECGGFMYLARSITVDDHRFEMVGVITGDIKMEDSLAAIGYREVSGHGDNYLFSENVTAKGHEFHYSTYCSSDDEVPAYHVKGLFGEGSEGVTYKNVIAGYTHLHFCSSPQLLENFLLKCKELKKQ